MELKYVCREDGLAALEISENAIKANTTRHILCVDDDICLLNISKDILELDTNLRIDCALSVDEAFSKLSKCNYDAIVSDFEMPKKDGLMFLKELRDDKNEIPFILFTGKGREEIAVKALNLGADGYINKQGNPETVYGELKHSIQSFIEKAESKKG